MMPTLALALVADDTTAARLTDALAADDVRLTRLRAGRGMVGSGYAGAALALVAEPAAMPAALALQRLTRVPWIAVLDADVLAAPEALPKGARAALGHAAALVVPAGATEAAAALVADARIVEDPDPARLRVLIDDIALAADSRSGPRRPASLLPDAWTFANDRAHRVAIRLMPLARKAPEPIHPKHLVPAPWHHWYLDAIGPDDRVIDVGCSDGAHSLAAAAVAGSVVGVDIDATALGRAERRAARDGIANARFVRGDLTTEETLAGLGRQAFDVALILDVLEHLHDRVGVLTAAHALLRPGGRVIVAVPRRDTPYKRWRRRLGGFAYADPDHKTEYDEASLTGELEAAGFAVERMERSGHDTAFDGLSALVAAVSVRAYGALSQRRHALAARRPDATTALRAIARAR